MIQRRFLIGSHWTALHGEGERHFEVIAMGKDNATLRAILTQRDVVVEIAALEDDQVWARGWIRLP